MAQLLQIFGFLSVLFRGGTLTFGSLTIGGIVFLNFVARSANSPSEAVNNACLRWIRRSALALAVMQLAYVLASLIDPHAIRGHDCRRRQRREFRPRWNSRHRFRR